MDIAEQEKLALDAVCKEFGESDVYMTLASLPNFYDGTLFVVQINSQKNHVNVFVNDSTGAALFYKTEHLAKAIGSARPRTNIEIIGNLLLTPGGVSAFVAALITITLCTIYIFGLDVKVPDILSNALTIILGYYFGTKVKSE